MTNGHQIVARHSPQAGHWDSNMVDGDNMPVRHFGVVLSMPAWQALADRLTRAGVKFIIEPHVLLQGQAWRAGRDVLIGPCGNALDFKAFEKPEMLYAR